MLSSRYLIWMELVEKDVSASHSWQLGGRKKSKSWAFFIQLSSKESYPEAYCLYYTGLTGVWVPISPRNFRGLRLTWLTEVSQKFHECFLHIELKKVFNDKIRVKFMSYIHLEKNFLRTQLKYLKPLYWSISNKLYDSLFHFKLIHFKLIFQNFQIFGFRGMEWVGNGFEFVGTGWTEFSAESFRWGGRWGMIPSYRESFSEVLL